MVSLSLSNALRLSDLPRHFAPLVYLLAILIVATPAMAQQPGAPSPAADQQVGVSPVINITANTQRLEMTANSSRILTVEYKIPQAQVNNPEILELRALSPNQLQVFAKKAGVTQINVWDEENNVHSMDVIVFGDAQELTMHLRSQFPSSSLKVAPLANSVVLSGTVDRPEQVRGAIEIASDYYPKVINNIEVSGVQQVLLHVKIMEVSRTKLRSMGFDFGATNGSDFVVSSISGLISAAAASAGSAVGTGGDTVRFGLVNGNNKFFGFLEALRQNDLMKILAEPTLVTVSGRAANFKVGGEFPILVPQSLGTVSIEYKTFGTQVDFVPVVLGNGRIHLEVRPRVSEVDDTRGVTIDDLVVPGLRIREVDTAVEMQAGQTLALAGLVQNRIEARNTGIPGLAELPWLGAAFRRVTEENNEVELLIMVTPELVDAMDCHEVPPGGPGFNSASPRDCDLYGRGHIEIPIGGIHADPYGRGGDCGPDCAPQDGSYEQHEYGVPAEGEYRAIPQVPEEVPPGDETSRRRAEPAAGPAVARRVPAIPPRPSQQVARRVPYQAPVRTVSNPPVNNLTAPHGRLSELPPAQPPIAGTPPAARPQPPAARTQPPAARTPQPATAPTPQWRRSTNARPAQVSSRRQPPSDEDGLIGPIGYDVKD